MEDIVVTLRWWTGPNVCPNVTLVARVFKIALTENIIDEIYTQLDLLIRSS